MPTVVKEYQGYSKVECGCGCIALQCCKCGKCFTGSNFDHRNIKGHATPCTLVREVYQEKGIKLDVEESCDYPRDYADQDIIDDDEPGNESVDS